MTRSATPARVVVLLQGGEKAHDLPAPTATRRFRLPPVLALVFEDGRKPSRLAPGGEEWFPVDTVEATEQCQGGTAQQACRGFCGAGWPTRDTLCGPDDSHRIDVGWGALVVLRPGCQLPGNPQAVVRP